MSGDSIHAAFSQPSPGNDPSAPSLLPLRLLSAARRAAVGTVARPTCASRLVKDLRPLTASVAIRVHGWRFAAYRHSFPLRFRPLRVRLQPRLKQRFDNSVVTNALWSSPELRQKAAEISRRGLIPMASRQPTLAQRTLLATSAPKPRLGRAATKSIFPSGGIWQYPFLVVGTSHFLLGE